MPTCCIGELREPEASLSHPQLLPALRTLSVTPVWQTLLKPEEFLPFGTTWMKLAGIILGEISHREKVLHGITNSGIFKKKEKKVELIETVIRMVIARV